MKTFIELFSTILTADKDKSCQAAREVRKLVYGSGGSEKYEYIASIIKNASAEYIKIIENWRQENFVMAISVMYLLHNRESQPDFLFPWLFELLQHKNGNIRHAAVRMIQNELGPLTYHIRFPGEKSSFHKFSPEQADQILFGLRTNLNNLAASSWKDSYKKFKYIDRLPSGTYKSVQLILNLLDDYYSEATGQQAQAETKEQIIERCKEIERELVDMLKETKSAFSLQDVRDAIFHEEDNDDMIYPIGYKIIQRGEVVAMFDRGGDASELSNVLELVHPVR